MRRHRGPAFALAVVTSLGGSGVLTARGAGAAIPAPTIVTPPTTVARPTTTVRPLVGLPASAAGVAAVAKASSSTMGAGTARVSLQMAIELDVNGKPFRGRIVGSGRADFASGQTLFRIDLNDYMKAFSVTMGSATAQAFDSLGDFSFDLRMGDEVLYLHVPQQSMEQFGTTKPWIRIDGVELAAYAGIAAAGQTSGPYDALAYLAGVSSSGLRTVGAEKVRGTDTTHYAGTMIVSKVLRRSKELGGQLGGLAPHSSTIAKTLGATGSSAPVDVWLDGAGRLRKLRVPVPFEQEGYHGSMVLTQEYYDFGVPVVVAAPPSGSTVNAKKVPALWQAMQAAKAER